MITKIFDFTDSREYLRHFFEEKKNDNPHFSYQLLAEKAGFNNRGFIFNIVNGKKRLSKLHCSKISMALGHTKKEADYFETIVAYTQAKNQEERSFFYKQALKISSGAPCGTKLIRQDQFEFLSKWYHGAIRSLIDMYPVNDNHEEVCRRLSAPVTPSQVKKSIRLLERLELIARGEDGYYHLTGKTIRTSQEIAQAAKNQFHVECTDLAKKSILRDPPESRNAMSITMGISKATYKKVITETQSFIKTLINLVNEDKQSDRVYQYELLLFPLSNDTAIPKTEAHT